MLWNIITLAKSQKFILKNLRFKDYKIRSCFFSQNNVLKKALIRLPLSLCAYVSFNLQKCYLLFLSYYVTSESAHHKNKFHGIYNYMTQSRKLIPWNSLFFDLSIAKVYVRENKSFTRGSKKIWKGARWGCCWC